MDIQPIDPDEFTEDMQEAIKHCESCNMDEAIKSLDRQIAKFEALLRVVEQSLAESEHLARDNNQVDRAG